MRQGDGQGWEPITMTQDEAPKGAQATRRRFLSAAAVGGAAATLGPARAADLVAPGPGDPANLPPNVPDWSK